ncbi:MAG: D-alanyl-D-alanine carboxypeptidase family protein [Cyanobacteria bacterium P01_D01_bin.36]
MSNRILAGRFELQKQLSQTAVGSVYLGCDRRQVQHPSCLITAIHYAQPDMHRRLAREVQIIEQLGHSPQVPSVLAYFHEARAGEEKGAIAQEQLHTAPPPELRQAESSPSTPSVHSAAATHTFYIVQSHILGHPLSKEITPGKKLSESYVSKLLTDVLGALCSVHRQGQVHQNLHPQNLIRQNVDGQIFLSEFGGLARLSRSEISPDGSLRVTTPVSPHPYLAPEQLNPDYVEHPKPASDLYALGLIAIEALTGRPHYDLSYDPNRGLLWREGVEVSLSLAEFIDRLVRHQCEDRFADAAEALDILRLGRDRHQVAHNSRLNTVVVSPGGRAKKAVSSGFSRLGGASPHSGRTSLSTTGGPNRPKPLNPRLIKLFIGGIAVAIALGVGVKAFQWGQYRFTQLPQSWEDWRGDKSKSSYAEAKPSELTALLRDGSIQLRPVAAAAFWEMVSAAEEDDVNLFALAGYQPEDATGNAANTAQNDYVTGYAIAIGGADESQDWQKSFAQSDAFDWLSANATNYGFELSITEKGLLGSTSPEPWHWRYVGDSQSQSIFANADR